jgi:DNA-binding transcriptional MerR regulator
MMKMVTADNDAACGNDVDVAGAQGASEDVDGFARIGELAKTYDVTLRTLRFYEDKGLLNPKRDGTTRLYTRRDVARLKLILMGRRVGFSLREVKQMIDLYDPSGSNSKQLKLALEKSEKQLGKLEKQRVALDEAISELAGAMEVVRSLLAQRQFPKVASS